ncbi:MAG: Gfo/Idh/MocA family oxidoreductase [Acidobacteriia bacterium]|nr:Gfo/Idh/MocA family oxidoreductase [Terriglobia bacterium]
MTDPIRLAILGCGTIARTSHLPAVLVHPDVRLAALVDSDLKRAQSLLPGTPEGCVAVTYYRPLFGQLDAIINTLPNSLHAPVTLEALRAGVHVLCEKPLATTAADARVCAETAEQKNRVLAVGMNRRFVASHPLLRLVLREGLLGPVQDYEWQYGGAFAWKSASGFYFSRALAGGGALIDFGVHMLDSLIDWFGPVSEFDYQDDNLGSGIEANALLDVKHAGPYGEIQGHLRVSRTYTLKNSLLVRGAAATAEIPATDPDVVILHRTIQGQAVSETLRLPDYPATSSFYKQLDNFVESIRGRQKPEADGRRALEVIGLIEDCYRQARRIPEPWFEPLPELAKAGA